MRKVKKNVGLDMLPKVLSVLDRKQKVEFQREQKHGALGSNYNTDWICPNYKENKHDEIDQTTKCF